MSIVAGNDIESSIMGNIPVGLYYYCIPREKINSATYLGFVDTIQSLTFNPFIEVDDMSTIVECSFDSDRYGSPKGGIPKCYRMSGFDTIDKQLYELNTFPDNDNGLPTFEPKLYTFPFRYFMITDYMNTPLVVKPELCENKTLKLRVKATNIATESKYNLYVNGYKGDYNGNLNGIVNNSPLMLPVLSSAYSQFLATSSASFNQGNINAMLENDLSLKQGLATNSLNYRQNTTNNYMQGISSGLGAIASLLSLNFGGVVNGAMGVTQAGINQHFNTLSNNLNNSQLKEKNKLSNFEVSSMANAKTTDLLNTPNSIKTTGNDTLFNLVNSNRKIDIIEFGLDFRYKHRIYDYFVKYGYKVNKWEKINVNSRRYFNFIKTNTCNIVGDEIAHEYLEEIKDIFNRGVTIWHVDNGANIGDYSVSQLKGNVEV
uniref:Major tail protein n=1 Tax=Podoviridae sp. ctPr92 TaxID=2825247 RepID=A0A8S5P883_9CAUD|nr:MAG TPA: Major tail protein [Podoviridae sp. ctPr92]